jgi:hypothetical protein
MYSVREKVIDRVVVGARYENTLQMWHWMWNIIKDEKLENENIDLFV